MLHCPAMNTRANAKLKPRAFSLLLPVLSAMLLLPAGAGAQAAGVEFRVTDASGAPLENVAVYVTPRQPLPPRTRREAVIEQVKRQFEPLVSVIQTGTAVNFPNRDDVRHHVYSFSPAKTFEIKLYVGTPAKPVLFDKPGEVVLGCNIHDQMRGFVLVVDTPFVAKTDAAGRALVEDLPAGEFDIGVWHYAQAAVEPLRRIRVAADQTVPAAFRLQLRSGQIIKR